MLVVQVRCSDDFFRILETGNTRWVFINLDCGTVPFEEADENREAIANAIDGMGWDSIFERWQIIAAERR